MVYMTTPPLHRTSPFLHRTLQNNFDFITLFTVQECEDCRIVKKFLDERNVIYIEIDISRYQTQFKDFQKEKKLEQENFPVLVESYRLIDWISHEIQPDNWITFLSRTDSNGEIANFQIW